MKAPVYNKKGEEVETILLPKEMFEVKMNQDLVYQVLVSQQANRRVVIAHTKTRKYVSGGGRKPWRQKGTGRARHGSRRSPIWVGGGVAFGPTKEKSYKKIVPKKMKRKALFMVLSAKAKDNQLFVVDEMEAKKPKTKEIALLLSNLRKKIKSFEKGTVLILLPEKDDNLILSARNIRKTSISLANEINVLDLMSHKTLLLPKKSVEVLKETFLK